ncbi:MAG: DNA methylase [Lachnospiraceae bacterium]|nr:DNA methylase [Lachnospiraceae bacterium]
MIDDGDRIYIAIDLKSFYASVECVARGRDPLTTNLVVADQSRTEKTICLAVSPSLKSYGISGRARLFEAVQRVKEVNRLRKYALRGKQFSGRSDDYNLLQSDPSLEVDFIRATPRMAEYMRVSGQIYSIYLRDVASEDIFSYSVDEVFIDATHYLKLYKLTPHEFAMRLIKNVLAETGITATAGIGTNMFLAKVAMDVTAKHIPADSDGVRIAELDVMSFRRQLWDHRPITDIWRIGRGIARRLEAMGIYTLGDIALCSVQNEEYLYREFGVNAELLINHAWGWEPTTISDVKAYKPENNSLSSGQVLSEPYSFEKGRLIVREMTDLLVLDLVEKGVVTDQMVLTVGYDIENMDKDYKGAVETDRYGRKTPKMAHGSINLGKFTSSTKLIMEKVTELYDRIVDRELTVRRMYVVANHVKPEAEAAAEPEAVQLSIFDDPDEIEKTEAAEKAAAQKERRIQETAIELKKKFGKNAILKGMNLKEGATAIERNKQVGGHKAGD